MLYRVIFLQQNVIFFTGTQKLKFWILFNSDFRFSTLVKTALLTITICGVTFLCKTTPSYFFYLQRNKVVCGEGDGANFHHFEWNGKIKEVEKHEGSNLGHILFLIMFAVTYTITIMCYLLYCTIRKHKNFYRKVSPNSYPVPSSLMLHKNYLHVLEAHARSSVMVMIG